MNALRQSGEVEVEWEYEWEGFGGVEKEAMVIVTGELENVGEEYVEELELDCQLLATDGSVLEDRQKSFEYIEKGEEQLLYWKFRPSDEEIEQVDTVEVDGEPPDE